jgi:biotin operon repressor
VLTLLDALAGLANDGKWYSATALGAKLRIGNSGVTSAIGRLAKVPGYAVEKRRRVGHANRLEYRITAGPAVTTSLSCPPW